MCCESYCALSTIKFLTLKTGGSLFYYDSVKNSSMPQDVFRYFKSCHAFNCLLRLRTSKECSISDSYSIQPDPVHDGLFRLAACDRNKNYCFALKFETPSGFNQLIFFFFNFLIFFINFYFFIFIFFIFFY